MPKDFEDCRKRGGRVRTEKPSKSTYRHVCYDDQGRHAGEKKRDKPKRGSKSGRR